MKKYIIIFFVLLATILFAQNPGSVELNNPVYSFLERMETMGIVTDLLDGVKPYSRGRIAEVLTEINKKREKLTDIDQRKLDDFLMDFRFEINPEKKHKLIPEGQNWYSTLANWQNFKNDFQRVIDRNYPEEENHVVMWEDSLNNFYFDFQQLLTFDNHSENLSRSASEQSYFFRGLIDNDFSYQLKVSLQSIRGDKGYREIDPLVKGTFSQESNDGGGLFLDRSSGELAWHTRFMDIIFAQQELIWGQGESGNLILSNYAEQYPYLQLSKSWGWGKFIAMHGKLQSFSADSLPDNSKIYPDKWVAAHRLEFSPWNPLTIGLNEVFIYGNRYADWAYMIPFNFYRAVQHKLRDRDNATISIDVEYIPWSSTKLYTTVFIDEMKFEKLGTNWWGNKHALQFGLYQIDPFGLPNLELRMEYSAIMPWVYTHKYRINQYESDSRSLGHWAGPNSEVYYVHLSKDFHARLKGGIKWMQYKKGANLENENVGGDLLISHEVLLGNQTEQKQTRKFLEGNLKKELSTQLYAQYEVFNDFYLSASYIWISSEQKNVEKKSNEFHLGFLFNY